MKVIVVIALLGLLMLTGCTDSANEVMTAQTNVPAGYETCPAEVVQLVPDRPPIPYRISTPCGPIAAGDVHSIIVEFDGSWAHSLVKFLYNPVEFQVLNANAILDADWGMREAVFAVENKRIALQFKFLEKDYSTIYAGGPANVLPFEMVVGDDYLTLIHVKVDLP